MSIAIENLSSLERRLTASLGNNVVDKAFENRVLQFSKNAKIKGFRQGKVPVKYVKKEYGDSLREEVLYDCISKDLFEHLKEKDVKVAGRPLIEKITPPEIKEGQEGSIEYVARFEIYPEIELADLSSVEMEKNTADITDEDIEKEISNLQENYCVWQSVERATQANDRISISFIESGVQSHPEKAKKLSIVLEDSPLNYKSSESLLNRKLNEHMHTMFTFPQIWHDKTYAGKTLELDLTIDKIEERHNRSREALMDMLKVENKDEGAFKKIIAEEMKSRSDNIVRSKLQEKVLEILIEKNNLELPRILVHNELETIKKEMGDTDQNQVSETELQEMAEKRVLLGLLVTEYIAKKSLQATPELMFKKIQNVAAFYPGLDAMEVIKANAQNPDFIKGIERLVLLDQVVDYMLGEMKVKELKCTYQAIVSEAAE